jgi:hypothetical protein
MADMLNPEHMDVVDLTVAEARRLLDQIDATDSPDADRLILELDKAQGAVHSGMAEVSYVLIRISP